MNSIAEERELNGELGAALGTAAFQNQATFVGAHPLQKSVNIAALGFFGLVSSFHIAGILTNEYDFVTEGYISDTLFHVDKLCIKTIWM